MLDLADNAEPAPTPLAELRNLSRIALYAALVGAGAFIHIPLGPLHISLQTMMVMLTGFVLGPRKAALVMLVYIAAGFIGLPVFGQGKAGPASFLGPTAGFFLGFVPAAVIAGLSTYVVGGRQRRLVAGLLCGAVGSTVLLLTGTLILRLRFIPDWNRAFLAGFSLFIVGDLVKMAVAVILKETFFTAAKEEGNA